MSDPDQWAVLEGHLPARLHPWVPVVATGQLSVASWLRPRDPQRLRQRLGVGTGAAGA